MHTAGAAIVDGTARIAPGRPWDLLFDEVPPLLLAWRRTLLPDPDQTLPVDLEREFGHVRRELAKVNVCYVGDVSDPSGRYCVLPPRLSRLAGSRWLTWIR